jgi:hypothetical protein
MSLKKEAIERERAEVFDELLQSHAVRSMSKVMDASDEGASEMMLKVSSTHDLTIYT